MSKDKLASVTDIEDIPDPNLDDLRIKARAAGQADSYGNPIIVLGKPNLQSCDIEYYQSDQTRETPSVITDNTKYSHSPRMKNFDQERLDTVVYLARALSKQEILDYFGIVDKLSQIEKMFFGSAYKRGVSQGKREAMEKLFISMGDRNGGVQALNYLRTHATRFPAEGTDIDSKKGSAGFNFTVNLDD